LAAENAKKPIPGNANPSRRIKNRRLGRDGFTLGMSLFEVTPYLRNIMPVWIEILEILLKPFNSELVLFIKA